MGASWNDNFLAAEYDLQQPEIPQFLWRGVIERLILAAAPVPGIGPPDNEAGQTLTALVNAYTAAGPGADFDIQDGAFWRALQSAVAQMFDAPLVPIWAVDGYYFASAAVNGFTSSGRNDTNHTGFRFSGQTPLWHSVYNSFRDARQDAGLTNQAGVSQPWRRMRSRVASSTRAGIGGGLYDADGHAIWNPVGTPPVDVYGNLLADGMLAMLEDGLLAQYDAAAVLWRYVGQGSGLIPDLLDSDAAAPNTCPAGECDGGNDHLGGHLIHELVKVMEKMKGVAGVSYDASPGFAVHPYTVSGNGGSAGPNSSAPAAEAAAVASVAPGFPVETGVIGGMTLLNNIYLLGSNSYDASLQFSQGTLAEAWGYSGIPAGLPAINGQISRYVAACAPRWAEWNWGTQIPPGTTPTYQTAYGGNAPGWAAQNSFALADQTGSGAYVVDGTIATSATLGTSTVPGGPAWPTAPTGGQVASYLGWEVGMAISVLDCWANGNFMYPPR